METEKVNQYNWLTPLKAKGDPYSDAVRALAHVPSETRSLSNKIASLKKLSPEQLEERGLELVGNPKLSALAIMRLASELIEMDLTPKLKIMLLDKLCTTHKTVHGQVIINEPLSKLDIFNTQIEAIREFAKNNELKDNEEISNLKSKIFELNNKIRLLEGKDVY